jgi:hypothetical protein
MKVYVYTSTPEEYPIDELDEALDEVEDQFWSIAAATEAGKVYEKRVALERELVDPDEVDRALDEVSYYVAFYKVVLDMITIEAQYLGTVVKARGRWIALRPIPADERPRWQPPYTELVER